MSRESKVYADWRHPTLTMEEIHVIVEEAHKQGLKVAAHATMPEGIKILSPWALIQSTCNVRGEGRNGGERYLWRSNLSIEFLYRLGLHFLHSTSLL